MRLATAIFAALLVVPAGVLAQQQEPAASTAPVALPAEALSYAADLEKQAPSKLLDWAKKHAKDLLRDEFTADELTSESIAKLFPVEPPPVQDAVRLLVGYEIYLRASRQQESRASTLRELDRDIADLEHRLRMLESIGAPIGSVASVQRENSLAAGQRRMEQLQMQRKLAASAEGIERKRVDTVLRWLADAHPEVKDTPPDALRSVPAPRT
jgi:hypothetical protein